MSLSTLEQTRLGSNPITAHAQRAEQAADKQGFFANGSNPSFSDLVDTVNPLQHLPVVSSMYQKASGDTIAPAAKIAGGFLMGGIFGAAAALASCVLDQAMGSSDKEEDKLASLDPNASSDGGEESDAQEIAQLDTMDGLADSHDAIDAAPDDIVDVAMVLDDAPLPTATTTTQPLAVVVPLNPFRELAQATAAQAQTQAATTPIEVASISRSLWQRMEKVYGESQALEALYKQLGPSSTLA